MGTHTAAPPHLPKKYIFKQLDRIRALDSLVPHSSSSLLAALPALLAHLGVLEDADRGGSHLYQLVLLSHQRRYAPNNPPE
eukprot:9500512-Pyramimonas_sp.AAC.1